MSFLADYLHYAGGNECPDMFHVWGGYTALSAAVSRKVWLPFEDLAIFPNIYVMYVGDAGNGKSWAMGKCKRILADAAPGGGESGFAGLPYSGSLETPPGMWRHMAGNNKADPPIPSPVKFTAKWPDGAIRDCHPMTIIANEFLNFISLDQQGWVSALNDIYDEDKYHYRTKNMGEDDLIGPYIVLIGALTTEVSSDLQKARIISTGLARRTIFQYGQRMFQQPHAIPHFDDSQKAARAACVAHLKRLNALSMTGAFTWTDEVKEWWTAWYGPHLAAVPTQNPSLRSWYASKSTQVLKLAMLTSLSEGFDLVLEIRHFQVALEYLKILELDLPKIFGGVGRNELAGVAMKMLEFIQNLREPMPFAKLQTQFFNQCKPPHDFDQCLTHLIATEQVVRKLLTTSSGLALDIIGTPEAMARFDEELRPQQREAPTGSPEGPADATGPSTSQAAPPLVS